MKRKARPLEIILILGLACLPATMGTLIASEVLHLTYTMAPAFIVEEENVMTATFTIGTYILTRTNAITTTRTMTGEVPANIKPDTYILDQFILAKAILIFIFIFMVSAVWLLIHSF